MIAPDLRGFGQSSTPESGYTKKAMAQDIHALGESLGYDRIRLVGHDIGLMVAYAYAAQYPSEVERIVLMEAFLPGVGDWNNVWLLRDLWHFHFYGETPLTLVDRPRAHLSRAFLERLRRRPHEIRLREPIASSTPGSYARPGHMKAGMEVFRAFQQDAKEFAELREDQTVDADAGAVRREGRRSVPDRAGQDGRDQCRGRAGIRGAGTG